MGKSRKYVQMDYYLAGKNNKEYLESAADTSIRMGRKLTKFVEASKSKLVGREFDILRGRLEMYAGVFNYFGEAVDILSGNIVSSNNKVVNIMGGHTEVTDEYIGELDDKIGSFAPLIAGINNELPNLDEQNQKKQKSLLSQYETSVAELRKERQETLDLIEAVEAADNSGISSVESVLTKVNLIKSKLRY